MYVRNSFTCVLTGKQADRAAQRERAQQERQARAAQQALANQQAVTAQQHQVAQMNRRAQEVRGILKVGSRERQRPRESKRTETRPDTRSRPSGDAVPGRGLPEPHNMPNNPRASRPPLVQQHLLSSQDQGKIGHAVYSTGGVPMSAGRTRRQLYPSQQQQQQQWPASPPQSLVPQVISPPPNVHSFLTEGFHSSNNTLGYSPMHSGAPNLQAGTNLSFPMEYTYSQSSRVPSSAYPSHTHGLPSTAIPVVPRPPGTHPSQVNPSPPAYQSSPMLHGSPPLLPTPPPHSPYRSPSQPMPPYPYLPHQASYYYHSPSRSTNPQAYPAAHVLRQTSDPSDYYRETKQGVLPYPKT